MRIGGLASGIDTDTIVNKLMKVERMPLQKMEQDKTWITWQRDAYREVNTSLLGFREELVNMQLSTTFRAYNTASTNSEWVTATANSAASETSYRVSDVTQLASAESVINSGSVFKNPSTIDTGKSLYELKDQFKTYFNWKKGSVESENIVVDSDNELDVTDNKTFTLSSLASSAGVIAPKTEMSVKVDGKRYDVVTSNTVGLGDNQVYFNAATNELTFANELSEESLIEIDYIADKEVETITIAEDDTKSFNLSKGSIVADSSMTINIEDKNGNINSYTTNTNGEILDGSTIVGKVNYDTGEITFNTSLAKDSTVEVTFQQNFVSFELGSYTSEGLKEEIFHIQGTQSFNSLISTVNSSDAGVSMLYDEYTGKMTISRTETGNFNGTEDDSEIVIANSAYNSFLNTTLNFDVNTTLGSVGKNAKFTLNGLTTQRSSNDFEVSGVTFTLKNEFTGSAEITTSNDTEKVFENIKSFVEKYNELIGKINDRLQEDKYRDYRPLTDEQREAMSEKQQELWEEKAKSGLLKGDSILSSSLFNMREDFYTQVENPNIPPMYQQLASIGITTTSNYLEGGKLKINEAELKEAIQNDPKAVEDLFSGEGTNYKQNGILERLYNTVNDTMDQITEKAGNSFKTENQYTIGKRLDNLDDRIDSFENRLTQIEDRYWRQFTAMEQAIQRMNSQSMYLMQQFGGGM